MCLLLAYGVYLLLGPPSHSQQPHLLQHYCIDTDSFETELPSALLGMGYTPTLT